jgi:hypothetical protein
MTEITNPKRFTEPIIEQKQERKELLQEGSEIRSIFTSILENSK